MWPGEAVISQFSKLGTRTTNLEVAQSFGKVVNVAT